MPPFVYQPLNARRQEIRLIRLLPGRFDDEIQVELIHVPLWKDLIPEYDALSYVWGAAQKLHTISVCAKPMPPTFLRQNPFQPPTIDGKFNNKAWPRPAHQLPLHSRRPQSENEIIPQLPASDTSGDLHVTENLMVALRHLRSSNTLRIIWIDAICINQASTLEKSVEVARMGSIYSKAAQTIVWLGPASETSGLAIETLRSIGQDIDYDRPRHSYKTIAGSQTADMEDDLEAMAAREPGWKAVQDLLYRPWFTRLWVYQEIFLSQQPHVVVGFSELSWVAFREALWWAYTNLTQVPSLLTVFDEEHYKLQIRGILEVSTREPCSTLTILQYTKSAACFDPQDRVYGTLNMNSDNLKITPDYSITKEEVYEQFTRAHIEKAKVLDMLRLCEVQNSSPTLPSWAPDLSIFKHAELMSMTRPSGNSRHDGYFSSSGKALHVMGIAVDDIKHLGESVPHTAMLNDILHICRMWEPSKLSSAAYIGGGTMMDAFVKTLVCGEVQEDRPPNTGDFPTLAEGRRVVSSFLHSSHAYDGSPSYGESMLSFLRGRSYGSGHKGYIGAFPAAAQVGDQICVLLGSRTPLLLRPAPHHEGQFQLVGDCYVAGLVDGEALLGPLPDLWKFGGVDQSENRVYMCEGQESTLEDPRLGPLPHGWQIRYDGGKKKDKHGNLCDLFFLDKGSGKETWVDPRLTKDNLIERGVDVKEFILI